MALADQVLLTQYKQGDPRAFRVLVERYTAPLFNLAFRLLRDPMEAENVTQETFLRVVAALERVRGFFVRRDRADIGRAAEHRAHTVTPRQRALAFPVGTGFAPRGIAQRVSTVSRGRGRLRMSERHLTPIEVSAYVEKELDDRARAAMDEHLAACASCRARVTRDRRMEHTLREMPRAHPPRDLAARIVAAVELRAAQGQARRERLPLIAMATFFSTLLFLWFGVEMLVAFQENGALDFFSLFASHPEVLANYSTDALFALVEALPLSEIALTLFALLTVIVLAQQLGDVLQPRAAVFRNGHHTS